MIPNRFVARKKEPFLSPVEHKAYIHTVMHSYVQISLHNLSEKYAKQGQIHPFNQNKLNTKWGLFFINRIFFSHQIDRISSWTFLNSLFIYSTLIQGTILFFTEFFRPENAINYFNVDKKIKKIMESHGIIIITIYGEIDILRTF